MSKPERKKLPEVVNLQTAMMTPRFVAFMRSRMRRWVMASTADQLEAFRIVRVVDFYLCTPAKIEELPLTAMARLELEAFVEERIEEIPQPLTFDPVVRGLLELPQGAGGLLVSSALVPHIADVEAFNAEYRRYAGLFN